MRFDRPAFLLCEPRHFEIAYEINPWMKGNMGRLDRAEAARQWTALRDALAKVAEVRLVEPLEGQPDMVFTANAALIGGDVAIPARFALPERRGEEKAYADWLRAQGYKVVEFPEKLRHEAGGDALYDRELPILWGGYGIRSDLDALKFAGEALNVEAVALRLVDERFYHLDTCFAPLEGGYLLYYPAAFEDQGRRTIADLVPADKLIAVDDIDADSFACNLANVGRDIFVNRMSDNLRAKLEERGFVIHQLPMSQFMLSGGAVHCLTLRLDEPPAAIRRAQAISARAVGKKRLATEPVAVGPTIATRRVYLKGHLIDRGLLSRFVECVRDSGGSWEVESFDLGRHHHDESAARLSISAPSEDRLEAMLQRAIEMGASILPVHAPETAAGTSAEALPDARLETVEMDGVAPGDFAITTIYPAEVRVDGAWHRLKNQRMDGVMAVSRDAQGRPEAYCKIIRDLKKGEKVVSGVDGIRVIQPRHDNAEAKDEFQFMGAGVSSERRVEVAVEQIAWDLERIRERGGRTVVVAGPVVIHTGGGPYLGELIREGYVSALLGGNAIAVHDMEHSLFGTSLGVDLRRGAVVAGGHQHHLRTINEIRKRGSIKRSVEEGLIKSGIMYECVKRGVPFSLAGSIRDDGPLPDTKMDLVAAQEEYQELIRGAEMILMLSSMLHSIGVGNMTPSGVKLICVDINPAVVTKLADRGSAESVGIVTDVGLFLRLVADRLRERRQSEVETGARA